MNTSKITSQSIKHPTVRTNVFIPRSFHVLVAECSERTSLITNELKGHYVNVHTGQIEHTRIFRTKQFYHLYFTPSRHFPALAYIQKYKGWGRFSCSCMEGSKQGYCQHIEELEHSHEPAHVEVLA